MIKLPKDKKYWKNKNIIILGGGKTGLDCARMFKELGALTFLSEKKTLSDNIIQALDRLSIPYETGQHSMDKFMTADFIIISPGIPLDKIPMDLFAGKKIPVRSEVEMAYRLTESPMIAITGSNGKTTTTSIVAEILRQDDQNIACGGNIGVPLITMIHDDYDYIVAEISSFQLETTEYFRPHIASILNLYDNHLDRHETWQNYRDIKKKIFKNQTEKDYAVLNADDERSQSIINEIKSKVILFSLKQELKEGVFVHQNSIYARLKNKEMSIMPVSEIQLKGSHNLENCLAATAMTLLAGARPESIRTAIKEFRGVEHRMEIVRDLDGVRYINDSKGTNYLATVKAIESFTEPTVLIAGGRDKGGDFSVLSDAIKNRIKYVILTGESADNFGQWLKQSGYNSFEILPDLENSVKKSRKIAKNGDIVLFSPACTSYDRFKNFEERGEVYKQYVKQLS